MDLPEIDDDDTVAPPQMAPPRRDWCHPADEDQQQWLLMFEDEEMGLAEYDNEDEARKAFAEAEANWNCHLFVSVARDSTKTGPDGIFNDGEVANVVSNIRALTKRMAALEDRIEELEDNRIGDV